MKIKRSVVLFIALMLIVSMFSGCLSAAVGKIIGQSSSDTSVISDDGAVLPGTQPAQTEAANGPEPTQTADISSTSGSGTSGTGTEPASADGLRFDGIYSYINDWDSDGKVDCYVFRFYPDGTMIRRSLEQYDETYLFFPAEKDFNRDTDEYKTYYGSYTVDDNWIEFTTVSQTGTVDYWGTVEHNLLRLDSHSNINGNEATGRPYIFLPFDCIPGWTSDGGTGEIRYDGVYCNLNDWNSDGLVDCYLFRFYPDGTMIRRSIAQYDVTDLPYPKETDFNRDTEEYRTYYGNYTVDDGWIEFATVSQTGTVDYWGTVENNLLRLDNHSNINGNEATNRPYIFIPFDYIPNWNN